MSENLFTLFTARFPQDRSRVFLARPDGSVLTYADLLDRSGFAYRYLPSYSPDLNPIEPSWAKMKSLLRKLVAHTAETLYTALHPVLCTITPQDARAFFRHAGYEVV